MAVRLTGIDIHLDRIPLPIAKRAALFGTVAGGSVGALRDVQRRISDKKLQLEVDNNHK